MPHVVYFVKGFCKLTIYLIIFKPSFKLAESGDGKNMSKNIHFMEIVINWINDLVSIIQWTKIRQVNKYCIMIIKADLFVSVICHNIDAIFVTFF